MRASLVEEHGLELLGSVFAAHMGLLALQRGILGFPGGPEGKESTCNVGDPHSIPEWGRSPGEEMATHSSILAWEIPWTEEAVAGDSLWGRRVPHD